MNVSKNITRKYLSKNDIINNNYKKIALDNYLKKM